MTANNPTTTALFSEVYYPVEKGWNLYIDGQPAASTMFKANYLLRAARLPAGQNKKVEMRFEPKSYYTGTNVSRAASVLVWLLLIGALYLLFKKGGGLGAPGTLPEVGMPKPVSATTETRPKSAADHRAKRSGKK